MRIVCPNRGSRLLCTVFPTTLFNIHDTDFILSTYLPTFILFSLFRLADLALPRVELVLDTLRNLLQQVLWEQPQAIPSNIQTLIDVSILIATLSEEVVLECLL